MVQEKEIMEKIQNDYQELKKRMVTEACWKFSTTLQETEVF